MLFRGRERLVHQRTELVNALRAVLHEYGYAFPAGIGHLKRIEALVEDPTCDLPALITAECHDLLAQIAEKTDRIDAKTKALKKLAAETDTARRLQTMPGVGAGGRAADSARGRGVRAGHGAVQDRARLRGLAWSCAATAFVWRQGALGRMTRAGQADIRRLLIVGAMSRLTPLGRRRIAEGSWLSRMLARKPKMLVAIALAGKMARQLWAMLTRNEDYRDPALAGAA